MSDETRYRFIEPFDSEECARLLARNRFFFGSLDPELSAERYDQIQKMKGLVFGVCADRGSEIIAMLCVYRAGADRSANPHQLFVSALLVDAAHRTKLYSFMQLYRLMLLRVTTTMPEIREILMEVYSGNLPSLYMQRMFGSVIVDPEMSNPEELFMRNFGPSLQRAFRPMWEVTHQKMEGALPPFDKKKVKDLTPLTEGRLVPVTNIVNGTYMTMFCNIYSGCVCRLRSEKEFFVGLEEDGFFVENLSDQEQTWSITPYGSPASEGVKTSLRLKGGARVHLGRADLPAGSGQPSGEDEEACDMTFMLEGTTSIFRLKAGEDWTQDPYNPEPAGKTGSGAFSLRKRTGLLAAADGEGVCFQELWPYVTSPYLFGTVIPDPERKLSVQSMGRGETAVSELRYGFRLERRYSISEEEASVQTTAFWEGGNEEEFDPAFALHLQDMIGFAEFRLASGESVRKTFDYVRDLKLAHDEVILYEFVHEAYSDQEFEKILLTFENSVWEITADRPFRAYLHSNYIFLRPIGWAWKDRRAEFGSIHIRRAGKSALTEGYEY